MIKINNKTNLPYKVLGQVIDHYVNNGKEDTLYVGKIDSINFKYNDKDYHADVCYGERSVAWYFEEVHII